MDTEISTALIAAGVSLLIAIGSWVFTLLQMRENKLIRQTDRVERIREKKVERVLEQLESYAELEDLYRLIASQHTEMVKDEEGQYVRNADGTIQLESRSFEAKPDLEKAIATIDETDDIRGAIALLVVRIHLKQSKTTDLLHELEPSGRVARALDVLYIHTVEAFDRAFKGDDFWGLATALDSASKQRRVMRAYVNHLAEESSIEDAELPPLPELRSIGEP